MEDGEDYELVDPVDGRPSEINIFFKIFSDNVYFLIVVWTNVKLEIPFAADDRTLRDKEVHFGEFDDGGITLVGDAGDLSSGKMIFSDN